MQPSTGRDLGVGIFVVVGLLALGVLSLQVGGLSFSQQTGLTLYATFDDIGSLSVRSPVRIGDTVTAQVTVADVDRDRRRVRLETACLVGGEVVLEGEALVLVPQRA